MWKRAWKRHFATPVKHIFSPWGDILLLQECRIRFNPSAILKALINTIFWMLASLAMQSLSPPARGGIDRRLQYIPPHLTFTWLTAGFHWGICSILSNSSWCSRATGTAKTTSARNTLPSPGKAALDTAAPASWQSREPASTQTPQEAPAVR